MIPATNISIVYPFKSPLVFIRGNLRHCLDILKYFFSRIWMPGIPAIVILSILSLPSATGNPCSRLAETGVSISLTEPFPVPPFAAPPVEHGWSAMAGEVSGGVPGEPFAIAVDKDSAESEPDKLITSDWRYMPDRGWQDLTKWTRPPAIRIDYGVNHVHPFLIGMEILLMSLGAAIWASEEWEVDEVFGRDHHPELKRRIRPRR